MSAVLDLNTTDAAAANLAAVKRIDPAVAEILATASHVALYVFDAAAKTWQKKNIDGVLYLIKRNNDVIRLLINNRNAPTAFVQDVVPSLEFQTKPPYLMYRDPSDDTKPVQGIWFHDPTEIRGVVKAIKAAMGMTKPKAEAGSAPSAVSTATAPVATTLSAPVAVAPTTVSAADYHRPVVPASNPAPAPVAALAPTVAALFGSQVTPANTNNTNNTTATALPSSLLEGTGALGLGAGMGMPSHGHASALAGLTASALFKPAAHSHAADIITSTTTAAPTVTSPLAALGEVNILLSKSQLQAVLMELVQDDSFVTLLHNKYIQQVVQQAQRR